MDKLERARSEIDEIDREMAELFRRRMEAVRAVAEYKVSHGLAVEDPYREAEILARNGQYVDGEFRTLYDHFQRSVMDISKTYQSMLRNSGHTVRMELGPRSYDVTLERGCLHRAGELFDLARKVLIVTDDGVPAQYARAVADQCRDACVVTVPQGEASKSIDVLQMLLERMTCHGMTRNDCVAAVGGGMVGDLAGLAASLYLRGVDFYNVPTTLLSQVDASVGGKTAINFAGFKNTVGTFYQPRGVLLDPDLLATLPRRQLSAGMAESVKMAATLDPELFALFEQDDPFAHLQEIIRRSVACKIRVVAADERESGVRRVLNFGHTIGHAIESADRSLLHGECVALGMLPMCAGAVRERLLSVYAKLNLPTSRELDPAEIKSYMEHDKKRVQAMLLAVEVPEIGRYTIRPVAVEELASRLTCITRGADTP